MPKDDFTHIYVHYSKVNLSLSSDKERIRHTQKGPPFERSLSTLSVGVSTTIVAAELKLWSLGI
jgi:hypothetical protein